MMTNGFDSFAYNQGFADGYDGEFGRTPERENPFIERDLDAADYVEGYRKGQQERQLDDMELEWRNA